MSRPTASFCHLPQEWQDCIESFLSKFPTKWYRYGLRNCFDDARSPADYTREDIAAWLAQPGARRPTLPPTNTIYNQRLIAVAGLYEHARTYRVDGKPLMPTEPPTKGIAYKSWSRPGRTLRKQQRASERPAAKKEDDPFGHLPIAWQACIHSCLASLQDISGSKSTYVNYRSMLARFFRNREGDPGTVSKTEILNFIQAPATGKGRVSKEAAAGTKNLRRVALKSLFEHATEFEYEGRILFDRANPARTIRNCKPARPYRSMSADEVKALFAVIESKRDYAIFLFAFLTAKRRAEVCALRWQDISPTVFMENGAPPRQGFLFRYSQKGSSREVRSQELPMSCYQAIVDYLAEAGRLDSIQPGDYVWTATYPGQGCKDGITNRPLSKDHVAALFRKYALAAHLDTRRISMHSLRHASAAARQQAGQTVQQIARALGHSDIATTFRYLQFLSGEEDSGAAALERRFAFIAR